jgi:hypothetical protein
MEPTTAASLQCVTAPVEVTMLASPTYLALLTMLEGKALKSMMIRLNS